MVQYPMGYRVEQHENLKTSLNIQIYIQQFFNKIIQMQVKTKIIESLFKKALSRECTFISSTDNLKINIDNL